MPMRESRLKKLEAQINVVQFKFAPAAESEVLPQALQELFDTVMARGREAAIALGEDPDAPWERPPETEGMTVIELIDWMQAKEREEQAAMPRGGQAGAGSYTGGDRGNPMAPPAKLAHPLEKSWKQALPAKLSYRDEDQYVALAKPPSPAL